MHRPNVDPTGLIATRVWSDVQVSNNDEMRYGPVTSPFFGSNASAMVAGLLPGDEYLGSDGSVHRVHLPKHTSNADAVSGGLAVGDLYLDITADATGQTVKEVV